ncbi:MAG TPA: hypothetical protein VMT58_06920 [Candidatus Binataceae bacterium]|nr:hypothetical protein [Candidatus Binataceae bacterium]
MRARPSRHGAFPVAPQVQADVFAQRAQCHLKLADAAVMGQVEQPVLAQFDSSDRGRSTRLRPGASSIG